MQGDPTVPGGAALEAALTASFGTAYVSRLQQAALQTVLREARAGRSLRACDATALERAAVEELVCSRLALANPRYLPRT